MTDDPKNNGGPTDEDFSVAIPDDLLDEAVKAVDKRVAASKAPPPEEEVIGEEVSVDVDNIAESTVAESGNPDEMSVDELITAGHLPDRVVLALEEEKARAEEFEAQAKEAKERLAASLADADNFRRRVTREKNDAVKFANEGVLKEILPVVDNLERALAHADSAAAVAGSVKEGVEITLRQFHHILQKLGVTKVKSDPGTPFDPHVHEGVTHQDRADLPAGSVAMCLQPGYLLHERLLRPAMVAVARGAAKATEVPAAPVATETPEEKAARLRAVGQAAREAREQKRLAREARRLEEAREKGGESAADAVAVADAEREAAAKARLERIRAAGAAARAAREAKRAEKRAAQEQEKIEAARASGGDAAADATKQADAEREAAAKARLERIRAAGEAARAARLAKRAAREVEEPTISEEDLPEATAPGSPAPPSDDARVQEKLERVRRAGAAAREARRAAKAAREVEEAREKDGDAAAAARSAEEAAKEEAAKARLERIRAAGAAARAARAAKREERAAAEAKTEAPAAAAAPAPGVKPKPSFEDDDLDSWESSVDAMRTDTSKGGR